MNYYPPVWDTREKSMCLADDSAGGVFRQEKGAGAATLLGVSSASPTVAEPDTLPAGVYEYRCPHCGGVAHNGNPDTGMQFRGSGHCRDCGRGFSIVGMKLKPVSSTPVKSLSVPAVPLAGVTADKPAYTKIDLPAELAATLIRLADTIPDDHLAGDGRENQSHVTVLYGTLASVDDIAKAVAGFGPVKFRLGEFKVFAGKKQDVLWVDVISPDMHRLHTLLSALPKIEQDFPDYVSHCTLAYVQSGLGEVYAAAWNGAIRLDASAEVDQLTYSGSDRVAIRIPLAADRAGAVPVDQVREKGHREDDGEVLWSHDDDAMSHPITRLVTNEALRMFGVGGVEHREKGAGDGEPPAPKTPKVPKPKQPKTPTPNPMAAPQVGPKPEKTPTEGQTPVDKPKGPKASGLDHVLAQALDNPQHARHISQYVANNPHEADRVAGELAQPPAQPPFHEAVRKAMDAGKTVTMHAHNEKGEPLHQDRIVGVKGNAIVGESGQHYDRNHLAALNAKLKTTSGKSSPSAPATAAQPSPSSAGTKTHEPVATGRGEVVDHDATRSWEMPQPPPVHPVQQAEPGKPIKIPGARFDEQEDDHTTHSMPGLDVSSPDYRSKIGGPSANPVPQLPPASPSPPQHQPIPSAPVDRRNDALDSFFAKPSFVPPVANEGNMRHNPDLDSAFGLGRPKPEPSPVPQVPPPPTQAPQQSSVTNPSSGQPNWPPDSRAMGTADEWNKHDATVRRSLMNRELQHTSSIQTYRDMAPQWVKEGKVYAPTSDGKFDHRRMAAAEHTLGEMGYALGPPQQDAKGGQYTFPVQPANRQSPAGQTAPARSGGPSPSAPTKPASQQPQGTHAVTYTDRDGRQQTADVHIPPGVHMADFALTMGKRFGWNVSKIAAHGGGEWVPQSTRGQQAQPSPQTNPSDQWATGKNDAGTLNNLPKGGPPTVPPPPSSPPAPGGGQPPLEEPRYRFTPEQSKWAAMLKNSGHGTLVQVNPGGTVWVRDRSGNTHEMTTKQLHQFINSGIPPVPPKANNPGFGRGGKAEGHSPENPVASFNREFQRRGLAQEVSGRTPDGDYVVHGHDGRAVLLDADQMNAAVQSGRLPEGKAIPKAKRVADAVPAVHPNVERKALAVAQRIAKRATTDRNAAILLQRSAAWANRMADQHADKIAHRFGGDREKARAALYKVIRHLSHRAFMLGKGGKAGAMIGGHQFSVTRRKGMLFGTTTGDPLTGLVGMLVGVREKGAKHAPSGGESVGGRKFAGGEFTPGGHTLTDEDGEVMHFTHPRSQAIVGEINGHKASGHDTTAAEVAMGNVHGTEDGMSDRDHRRLVARRLAADHRDAVRLGKDDAAGVVDSLLTGEHVGADRIGEVGQTVPFNPVHHEADTAVSTGQPVRVERHGYRMGEGGDREYVLSKAKVRVGS